MSERAPKCHAFSSKDRMDRGICGEFSLLTYKRKGCLEAAILGTTPI